MLPFMDVMTDISHAIKQAVYAFRERTIFTLIFEFSNLKTYFMKLNDILYTKNTFFFFFFFLRCSV